MKKFLKSFLVLVLCVCTCLGFAGCKKGDLSATTNITEGVRSNGGVVLYYDGWIYFVNGTKTVNETNAKKKNTMGGIYRIKADVLENGNIDNIYKETEAATAAADDDEEEEEKKEFRKVEPVVRSLTGFDDGSIFIFGNFLYYATPCTSKNKDGDMLTGKTVFKRYDLKKKQEQTIYTTAQSDDTIQYTYYKQGSKLYFVIYEQGPKTLKAYEIGKKIKRSFVKKDVQGCILSENFGEEYDGIEGAQTDKFIYFTLNYDEESTIRKGNRVFRILPDGTGEKKISEGHTLSLLSIKCDYLIYSEADGDNTTIYAQKVTDETTELKFSSETAICYKNYDNIMFTDEEGKLTAIVYDGNWIRRVEYQDGQLVESEENLIYEMNFDGDEISFIGFDDEYIFYQLTSTSGDGVNLIYKLNYKADKQAGEEVVATVLSTTKLDSAKGLMAPEIMGGYIYGFYTDSAAKTTYLYRINILTPAERGEVNDDGTEKKVGEAEFIGVAE